METRQIRLNINELLDGIQDEGVLKACYEAVADYARTGRRATNRTNGSMPGKMTTTKTSKKK